LKVRPGRNLVRAIVVLLLLSPLVFLWLPTAALLVAALAALAIAAIRDWRELTRTLPMVSVSRALPTVIGRDLPFDVQITAHNACNRRLVGELRDVYPSSAMPAIVVHPFALQSHNEQTFVNTCRIRVRGRNAFGPIWVRLHGPWGVLEAQRAVETLRTVKVLPETFASREQLQKDIGAEIRLLDRVRRARQQGTGTEFESLYPFRLGDDPRRIDWRATARQQTLVVRRFRVERHRDVMILLDNGRLMGAQTGRGTKLDCAVDSALHLARVALQSGDRCGIAVYDNQVRGFLPPIAGTSALRSLVECVFGLQTQWHESDFAPMLAELRSRQAKRTFLIVISDLSDAETSARLCASLQQLQRHHLVLFAALKTPLLRELVQSKIETTTDIARKAVAFRLLSDRDRALHALRRGGVHVLDVEPQNLTLPLVNQFIDLRQRNLL
jgi:uncharacterized protein (DUF58 family)